MKFALCFRDPEPIHGGWFHLDTIEAKNLKEAKQICAEKLGSDKFDENWMYVKVVRRK